MVPEKKQRSQGAIAGNPSHPTSAPMARGTVVGRSGIRIDGRVSVPVAKRITAESVVGSRKMRRSVSLRKTVVLDGECRSLIGCCHSSAWLTTCHAVAIPQYSLVSLYRQRKLSQVWWTDEGPRAAHRCRNPTSFSTGGHCCGMKRLSLAPSLRVSRHVPDFYASPPNRSLLPTSSTTLFEVVFRSSQLLGARCRVWLSEPQSPHTSTTLLHPIEFA